MEFLRTLFELEANRAVLDFAHGLVFFLAGFAVLLKTKRWSELTLARGLPFLGIFGVLNAFGDWGLVFVPIQREVFSDEVIGVLWTIDIVIIALSYTFLMLFGAHLAVGAENGSGWLSRIQLPRLVWGTFLVWLGAFFLALIFGVVDPARDLETVRPFEIAYRYCFALTGSLLSAWGLMRQKDELERLDLRESVQPLKWVGYALVLHGVAAGLFGPEADFFPANMINASALFSTTGIPARVWTGVSGMIVAIFMVISLDVFDVELGRRLETNRRVQAVLEERLNIARDLHDGIIQTLYALGLHLERALMSIGDSQTEVKDEIRQVMGSVDRAIKDVRDYIVRLKRPSEALIFDEQLALLMRQLRAESPIPIELESENIENASLSAQAVTDLIYIVREGVSNAIRHAQASQVRVVVRSSETDVDLKVTDDGKGFDPSSVPIGSGRHHHGLKNMRHRAESHGGTFCVESAVGKGTAVQVRIPVG